MGARARRQLMYLGGNGLNCEVEMIDEQTGKVKNGDGRGQRAESYESRFHQYNEAEANLNERIPGGASGHETDKT